MHPLLTRQLKRALRLKDPQELGALLDAVDRLAGEGALPDALRGLGGGLRDLLERIGSTYQQHDRDLELRIRSLNLSTEELVQANDRLRAEAEAQARLVRSLRTTANQLLASMGREPIGDEADDLPRLTGLMAELVADRRKAQRELEQQKVALDEHAIVSITDTRGTILYANDRFCSVSGYARHELLGANHRIVKSGLHPRAFFTEMWGTITAGRVWNGEVCNRTKGGRLYWVAATIVPILGEAGLPESYIAIRTDITNQKIMEKTLGEQQRFMRSLTDSMGEGVYALDEEGRCLFLNPEAERLLGWTQEELAGQVLHDLIHHTAGDGSAVPASACVIFRATAGGGTFRSESEVFTRKDGGTFPISIVAVPQRTGDRVSGQVAVFTDITEKKQAEAAVREARDWAIAASRAKSEFLANMSHEIRTPLNAVIGLSHLALDACQGERERSYLTQIHASGKSLLWIINEILDLSKIEAGRMALDTHPFQLQDLLSQVLAVVGLAAGSKGLALVVSLQEGVPEGLVGDAQRLKQVLTNLAGNAVKFTQEGEVELRVAREDTPDRGPRLRFLLRDTGIGISEAQLGRLFKPFTQADSSTTRTYGGTGLGLTISKRLVELMEGTIEVVSDPGRGSTFCVDLPLAVQAGPAPEPPVGLAEAGPVLVAEGHAATREALLEMLRGLGLACQGAATAEEAARALEGGSWRTLLLEWALPGSGALRQTLAAPGPRVILLEPCGSGLPEEALRGDHPALLRKPVLPLALSAMLEASACALPGPRPQPAPGQRAERLKGLRVLLVEDDRVNRLVAREILSRAGLVVTCAENGVQAMTSLEQHSFDLVLMDVQMPELDGYEATRRIRVRGHHPGLPIIALTAHALQEAQDRCLAAGMNDCLTKPIEPERMLDMIARWVQPGEEPQDLEPGDRARAEDLALRLGPLLARGDLLALDLARELAGILSRGPLRGLAKEVESRLQAFDFDRAATSLAELGARLEPKTGGPA